MLITYYVAIENVFCACIACNAIIIMVCEVLESFRPTQDKIECLHNLWAFSQALDCLDKAMQKQQKVFYSSYKISFLKKNKKFFVPGTDEKIKS